MSSYGIDDIKPHGDVTIVGLYYSDSQISQEQVPQQEELGKDLINEGFRVVNVAINNYAPKSCALESDCKPTWWYFPWYPSYSSQCQDYIDGCPPNDPRLHASAWQRPFTNLTTIPFFQDKEWQDTWDKFGGGENDIFIYDSQGKLFKYICSSTTCGESSIGTITTATGYEYVKTIAEEAAKGNSTLRCSGFNEDDWYYGYADIADYYYYYGDDAKQGLFVDDDKDKDTSSSYGGYSADDDDLFISPDIENNDLISSKIKRRQIFQKHPVISSTVYASVLALSTILITFGVLYYKYKSRHADVEYLPLSSNDHIDDFKPTATVSRIAGYGANQSTSKDIEKSTSYGVY
eukprot:gene17359-22906_t